MHAKGRNPDLDARLQLAGDYRIDLPAKQYELAALDLKLAGTAAQKKLDVAVSGGVKADLAKETLAADLKTKFDESTIQAKLGLAKFSPPAYTFDVDVDQLNLDRYMPKEDAQAGGQVRARRAAAGNPGRPVRR